MAGIIGTLLSILITVALVKWAWKTVFG